MRQLILLCPLLCAIVLAISANPARAQNVLWVSSGGNDANPCSAVNPCATFQGAIDKGSVAQVNCLGSGSYGAFTVTASITIDCGTGNIGNVAVSSGTAITINTSSTATIVLRHLSLNGLGSGLFGIAPTSFPGGALIVEDCMIHGFGNGSGIHFEPSSGRGLLQVSNSRIFNNVYGIVVSPSNGQIASVMLNRVEIAENFLLGLSLGGSVVAGTMRLSVVAANGVVGVVAAASQVYFTIEESSIIANLGFGIRTFSAGSVVNVGASTIGGNGTGVQADAGSLISFGNNQMSTNGSNGSFTATTPLQ